MRKLLIVFLGILYIALPARSESPLPEIRVSEVMQDSVINLYRDPYVLERFEKSPDTVRIVLRLIHDLERDTTLYLYEVRCNWIHIVYNDVETSEVLQSVSGRDYYSTVAYDYLYFPCRPLRLKAGHSYDFTIRYAAPPVRSSSTSIYLVSPAKYVSEKTWIMGYEYINNLVTYFYVGALTFGFFFFLFFFIKSHYHLFGLYAAFLFTQVLYGVIQFDVYTSFGSFMKSRFYFDDYVNEVIVFIGQAIYVYFMSQWLGIKNSNPKIYRFLVGLSIFFLTYALSVATVYNINRYSFAVDHMFAFVRMTSIGIQLILYYLLIFKVKSPVRGYVLAGTTLVVIFGVGFVSMNNAGWFKGTQWDDFDNGSWFMVGILCECMCFASGLGLRYFLMDQSNRKLQEENIQALEEKLGAEQSARENERQLALVNQELTNQQLTALRAQMNPHFIFNALNSIQKYIVTGSVDEANSYLSKFSRLQRMILSYSEENFITLDKEIDMLRLYLELEQLRLTNEFNFDIQVDAEIEPEEILIPPMMLQPFAENAIWHGLIPKQGEKKLRIKFSLDKPDILTCLVEDNGIGREAAQKMKEEKQAGNLINKSKGMSLVYNRLAILEKKYGAGFSVKIIDKTNAVGKATGTLVELEIPVKD